MLVWQSCLEPGMHLQECLCPSLAAHSHRCTQLRSVANAATVLPWLPLGYLTGLHHLPGSEILFNTVTTTSVSVMSPNTEASCSWQAYSPKSTLLSVQGLVQPVSHCTSLYSSSQPSKEWTSSSVVLFTRENPACAKQSSSRSNSQVHLSWHCSWGVSHPKG